MPESRLDVAGLLVSLEALNWASSSSTHAVLQSHTGSGSTSPKHSRGGNRTLRGDAGGEKSAENARSHTHHKGNQERCMHTHAHRYKIHNQKQSVNTYKVAQVNLTIITLNDNAQRCWTHQLQCTSHLTWCIQGDRQRESERGKQSANGERKVPVGFSFESCDWFAETSERMVGEFRQFADRPSNPIISHCTKVALLFFTVSLGGVMLQCLVNVIWRWGFSSKIQFSTLVMQRFQKVML